MVLVVTYMPEDLDGNGHRFLKTSQFDASLKHLVIRIKSRHIKEKNEFRSVSALFVPRLLTGSTGQTGYTAESCLVMSRFLWDNCLVPLRTAPTIKPVCILNPIFAALTTESCVDSLDRWDLRFLVKI